MAMMLQSSGYGVKSNSYGPPTAYRHGVVVSVSNRNGERACFQKLEQDAEEYFSIRLGHSECE
jgi:hypothetical protein